mmetsp:Transcript_4684/g.3940  ORF Transcript_4684/g.3940 Transcript_4684/m.3940 type:complete len:126 (+) Transcript_4684:14-391(+)
MEGGIVSDLAKKEHWDTTFDMEIDNFEENGDEGEVWFGEDVQQKSIQFIKDKFDLITTPILDVGTGNAAFLIACRDELGFNNLKGIDYSDKSILLSQKILDSKYGSDNVIVVEQGDAFDHPEEEK